MAALSLGSLNVSLSYRPTGVEAALKSARRIANEVKKIGTETAKASGLISGAFALAFRQAAQYSAPVAREMDKLKGTTAALSVELATAVLPVVRELNEKFSSLVGWFQSLDQATKDKIARFAELAVKITLVSVAVAKLASLGGAFAGLAAALIPVLPVVLGVAAALAAILAAVIAVRKAWKENWGGIADMTARVVGFMTDKLRRFFKFQMDSMRGLVVTVAKGLNAVGATGAATGLLQAFNWSEHLFSTEGMRELFEDAKDTGRSVGQFFKEGLEDIAKDLNLGGIMSAFSGKSASVPTALKDLEAEAKRVRDIQAKFAKMNITGDGQHVASNAPQRIGIRRTDQSLGKMLSDALNAAGMAVQKFAIAFASKLGQAGTIVSAAASGGFIAAFVELLSMSKQFQDSVAVLNGIVQLIADTLGMVLSAVAPLLGAVYLVVDALLLGLAPVFELLGSLIKPLVPIIVVLAEVIRIIAPAFGALMVAIQVLQAPMLLLAGPIMRGLFEVFKVVGVTLYKFLAWIGPFWNGVVRAVQSVINSIASIFTGPFQWIGDEIRKVATGLDAWKINVDAANAAAETLWNTTYEEAAAKAANTAATVAGTQAVNSFAASLTNAPSGFRVEAARFNASDAAPARASAGRGGGTLLQILLDSREIAARVVERQGQAAFLSSGARRVGG